MSWMKRRGQASSNTSLGPRMYNPNQHSNQHQWQQPPVQPYDPNNWQNQPKVVNKDGSPVPAYSQPNTQNYWQQPYMQQGYIPPSQMMPANQYNQHHSYYQNQGYGDNDPYQQNFHQQNYYGSQQQPLNAQQNPNLPVNQTKAESDPWNWGWEDNNSNQQSNNQNVADNFSNDESWNWSVDDSGLGTHQNIQNNEQLQKSQEISAPQNIDTQSVVENHDYQSKEDLSHESVHNFKNIAHSNNPVEQVPHAAVTRLAKSENLTPQWSIESQISQDSSDDILLTSESDNRSNILSRSSTVSHSPSRPASTHDNAVDYPSHTYKYESEMVQKSSENEQSASINRVKFEEASNSQVYQENSIDRIEKTMQGLSLHFENKEIVTPEVSKSSHESLPPIKETTPPPRMPSSTKVLPPPMKEEIKSNKDSVSPPVRPSSAQNAVLLPPTQPVDPNKNPYKRNTALSHSAANKLRTPKEPSNDGNVQNLYMPSNTQQPPRHENMGVNLETLPDNSERLDQLPVENVPKTVRKTSTVQQQWLADNCEIAPINDRNQYLETGQLSDADVPVYNQSGSGYDSGNTQGASSDNVDSLPPPGLRRLVLGQLEQSESNQSTDNIDEPPPGLSRMVLGRTETDSNNINQDLYTSTNLTEFNNSNVEEPPVGLHRMIPGESSSPESSSYSRYTAQAGVFQPSHFDDDNYASETELNQLSISAVSQRSATIGADTPPAINQQITTTAGYSSSSSGEPIISRVEAVGIDSEPRDTDVDGANTLDESLPSVSSLPPDNNRRDNIDGGPQEDIIAVRNQIIGQNPTDVASSNNNQQEKVRKTNRSYTTDSEHESREKLRSSSPSRYEKDRRFYDDRRDRLKERESPDRYRDRNYDRRINDRHNDRRLEDKRYDDDTDYYSDKERSDRRHRDERDDYDKRYSSLRRDKDRDKRRKEYRDDRDRRTEYYYRYDDDYYNREHNRSRPSSRSDSIHDSYRERGHRHERDMDRSVRHRERDREKDRRARDPYNQYYPGYHNFDPYNPYYQQYQQYQYYENLRRTNPQAYADWYRKYYQSQTATSAYNAEDRASVHSGRSSANGDINKDRLMDHTDSSLNLEDTTVVSQRLTPAKFSTAHVKASISSGYLINVLPHYPLDGQPAMIEVINIQNLLQDNEEMKELLEFPGPLIKGITHKKTVIDYCENKIKKANSSIQDVESYVLMWELLILLLRQNGMVVGTDIAELLMKNKTVDDSRSHSVSSASSTHVDSVIEHSDHNRASPSQQSIHQYKDDYITDKFREYLIYGFDKEALEWAMKHGLWGHALFLASKLDKKTYANVMMRFANGLTMNDPLQTLYQLLSGRQPAAVTCVADEKWGDWRPHLAMILSNTKRPELDRKAITTLGDTLFARGSIYAAQFCYLMAQVEFGRYDTPNTKLVLLGSSHHKPFNAFATNEAIFMTEVYEYACSLSDPTFSIPEFLQFKYLLSTRLVDHGLLEKGLQYLERTADGIVQNPTRVHVNLVSKVCELSDKLKYFDPLQEEELDANRADATWLSNLKAILSDFNMGLIQHQSLRNLSSSEIELSQEMKPVTSEQQMIEQQWQQQAAESYYQQSEQQSLDYTQQQQQQQQQQQMPYQEMELTPQHIENEVVQDQSYWNQPQQQQQQTWEDTSMSHMPVEEPVQNNYWNNQTVEELPQPQITMPTQSRNIYDEPEEKEEPISKPTPVLKPKHTPVAPAKPASAGWFGGIWNKLSLRPKNQMKLPDDKNPTIVWDSEKKRWVNLEADGDEASSELKPPPKMSEMNHNNLMSQIPKNPQSGNIPLIPTEPTSMSSNTNIATPNIPSNENDNVPKPSTHPNMFKLQRRGRNIKNAYVDVFNPGGVKPAQENIPSAEEVFGAIPSVGTQMNYFVPAPVSDSNAPADFLTPASVHAEDNTQVPPGPMMYNPNEFSSNQGRGRNH